MSRLPIESDNWQEGQRFIWNWQTALDATVLDGTSDVACTDVCWFNPNDHNQLYPVDWINLWLEPQAGWLDYKLQYLLTDGNNPPVGYPAPAPIFGLHGIDS